MKNVYINGVKADKSMLDTLSVSVKNGTVYIIDITFNEDFLSIKTQEV